MPPVDRLSVVIWSLGVMVVKKCSVTVAQLVIRVIVIASANASAEHGLSLNDAPLFADLPPKCSAFDGRMLAQTVILAIEM